MMYHAYARKRTLGPEAFEIKARMFEMTHDSAHPSWVPV